MKERQPPSAPENPRTDLRTRSFFKTPAGIVTIIIFGAGVGYALYLGERRSHQEHRTVTAP